MHDNEYTPLPRPLLVQERLLLSGQWIEQQRNISQSAAMGRKVIATKPRMDPIPSTGKKRDRSAEWKPRKIFFLFCQIGLP